MSIKASEISDLIQARMRAAYGDSLRLVYSYRNEIPLTPTGKLRVAISTLSSSVSAMVADAVAPAREPHRFADVALAKRAAGM